MVRVAHYINQFFARTGIHERHVGGTTAGLSIEAGRRAIEMAGLDPAEIDALILATTTPDRMVPATSATVQVGLGLRCGAYDINAACSGWAYGLVTAHGLIALGAEKILLIGTDSLARITDWTDRNTAILFADGSGATVIEAVEDRGQLLAWDLDADGSAEEALFCEHDGKIQMEGREVFRRAVRIMVDSATTSIGGGGCVRPTTSHWSSLTRRTSGSSRPRASDSGSASTAPRSYSTAPATPRRHRSRSPSPTPWTRAGCRPATSSCSSASEPA